MSILLMTGGSREVVVDGEGYDGILRAVRRCESSGLAPMRVWAHDWLTLAEIAERVGRSREIARLWSIGRVGPADFPPPLNPGGATSFYSWAEVGPWLRRAGHAVPREEPMLAAMNLALQLRRLAPRITRMDSVVACAVDRRGSAGPR
jgi:hypothetical protein